MPRDNQYSSIADSIDSAMQAAQDVEENVRRAQHAAAYAEKLFTSRTEQVKAVFKVAMFLRERAKEHVTSTYIIALLVALVKDLSDMVTVSFSLLISWPITLFLIIFLWGRGTWKIKILLTLLSFLEVIPAISVLPVQCIMVGFAYIGSLRQSQEDTAEAEDHERTAEKASQVYMHQFHQMKSQQSQQPQSDESAQDRAA